METIVEISCSSNWYDINFSPIRTYHYRKYNRNSKESKMYILYLNLEGFFDSELKFIYSLIDSKDEDNFIIAKAITDNERDNSRK